MTHQQTRLKTRRSQYVAIGIAIALIVSGVLTANIVLANDNNGFIKQKGGDSLSLVSVVENLARCGASPTYVELHFEGVGMDTIGGQFDVISSACQNTVTNEVFDLVAVDTYVLGGSVEISSAPFILVPNPETCISTNEQPVKYILTGGPGIFANAIGKGKYDIAVPDPACSGVVAPAIVWFKGKIKLNP